MTHPKTEDLLKKINYIEADLEIQKQILFSIPSANKEEIEKTIPADDTTIGLHEDTNQENEIPLIAPLAQKEDQNPTTLGVLLLAIASGTIATVFIVIGNKKLK